MSRKTLILEFYDASAPLRKAMTEEVVMRRFGGVGPQQPRILRVTVEYDDPRPCEKSEIPIEPPTERPERTHEDFGPRPGRTHDRRCW